MKKIASLLLSSIFVTSTVFATQAHAEKPVSVIVNGEYVQFNVDPYLDETGTTLVEFRPIFMRLGLDVSYDPNTNTVSGGNEKTKVLFYVNQNVAQVNGKSFTLPVTTRIISGHTMIPLRFLSEAMGDTVRWDGESNSVIISNESSQLQNVPEVGSRSFDNMQDVKVFVNGNDIQENTLSSVRVSGRVYSPFNDILKYLVDNGKGDTADVSKDHTSAKILHDGTSNTISTFLVNGKVYLPIDDVARIFNASIVDNGDQIQITSVSN